MRQLRAVFVLFHVVAITLMSIPAPVNGMNRAQWDAPAGQAEIHQWAEAVRALGLDVTDQVFEDFVWNAGGIWLSLRSGLIAPFKPYLGYTGNRQSWRMFSLVEHDDGRLCVYLDRGTGREPLFVTYDHEVWRRTELRQERTRSVLGEYFGLDSKRTWNGFVDRLADWARADFPDGRVLEAELHLRRTPPPGGKGTEFTVQWHQQRTLR